MIDKGTMPQMYRTYFKVIRLIRHHLFSLLLMFVLTGLIALLNVVFMPLMKELSSQVANKNLEYFTNNILNMLILMGLRSGFQYWQMYVVSKMSYQVLIRLRLAVYDRLQRLSLSFHHSWKVGDLMSRALVDVERTQMALKLNFESFIPGLVTVIGVYTYMLILDWRLSLILSACIPLFVLSLNFFGERIRRISLRTQASLGDIAQGFKEDLSNIKVIQAYNLQDYAKEKFRKKHEHNFQVYMKDVRARCNQQPVVTIVQSALVLTVLWFGGYQVLRGHLSAVQLLEFFTGIFILADSLREMSHSLTHISRDLASAERVFELLAIPDDIPVSKTPIQLSNIKGSITFESVSFTYKDQAKPVLEDVNIDINAGEILALVGSSGAGKSTLAHLLPRFYDVDSGHIRIDGVDIRDLDLQSLRNLIAMVPQDVQLFAGTVFENVRLGRLDASVEEVEKALEEANAWEFVSKLPHGVFSRIEEDGVTLSGGQRQRLSIARALLKNPKILILDEATSSLDSESEHLVSEACKRVMVGRTTIIIAHRLSTVMDADKIVVIEEGRVAQVGQHTELMKSEGVYQRLSRLQFGDPITDIEKD